MVGEFLVYQMLEIRVFSYLINNLLRLPKKLPVAS